MKIRKYLFLIVWATVSLLQSCYKDDSTLASKAIPEVKPTNINAEYTLVARVDTLKIKPTFETDANLSDFNFLWLLYSENFTPEATTMAKADTLSSTKDLSYFITQKPGKYILTFNITHKETGVKRINRAKVTISTQTMTGWYVLKDENDETDFDFYSKTGKVHNWIATFNNGKSLPGSSIKSIFIPDMRKSLTTVDRFPALGVITNKDAGIYKLEDGETLHTYDKMFFTKPAVRKPQNMYAPMGGRILLVNNGQPHYMTKGTLFDSQGPNNYQVASKVGISPIDVFFDQLTKSIVAVDGGSFRAFLDNGKAVKNTESDLVWMEGYVYPRNSTSLLLKHNQTGVGRLIKLNSTYTALISANEPFVILDKVVEKTHPLLNADIIGGNFDNDLLYYAKENRLYAVDYTTLVSELQTTFAAGEQVTAIQHIKYPVPNLNQPNRVNYIAVATYANGRYKVWLYEINSLGRLVPKTTPNFEGTGRVSTITYLENGEGSRTF